MRTALALALAVGATAILTGCRTDARRALFPTLQAPTGAGADRRAVTAADRELMRSFVTFARSPTDSAWRRLRLARRVELGLGRRLVVERSALELRDPEAWRIDVEHFRGYVGPFSALRLLADSRGPLQVSVGPHSHCASPPVPPPQRVAALTRVSVQPESPESCLAWFSIDAFVDAEGRVRAVTLDAWEP